MDGLAGEAAVITGAASGIGFAARPRRRSSASPATSPRSTARGGRCNAVAPGAVLTPALRDNLPIEALDAIRRHTSLGQLGEPADVAHPDGLSGLGGIPVLHRAVHGRRRRYDQPERSRAGTPDRCAHRSAP